MNTLLKEIENVRDQAVIDLLKKYENKWFYGNDGFYYYLLYKNKFIKSNGKQILKTINLKYKDILSFELIGESEFKNKLDIILAKNCLIENKYNKKGRSYVI